MLVRALVVAAAMAGMVVFAALLARVTLEPSAASEPLTRTNLHPGASIRDYLADTEVREAIKQIGGNIALGAPFGLLLPLLAPTTRGLLRVAAATAMVMLAVEFIQGSLLTGRAFDIDDVLLNTTGALCAYLLLGRRLGRAVHPRPRRWWQRSTEAKTP
ncbi:VanZ family protein [Streptomyces boninensis]|uniref:VanZ family protein n=1 Tax=Streptomyces boninensis TaxID=2039455 RepID=UPI003B21299E